MDTSFVSRLNESPQVVRHWWLLLIVGILLFAAGLAVLWFPMPSYALLSLLFGLFVALVGLAQIIVAATNNHYMTSRGWMWVGGLLELILGLILLSRPLLSEETLPYVLGFWLLLRGFSAVGTSGDLLTVGIPGAAWSLFVGLLLIVAAFWVLFQPLVVGTSAVVVWIGVSLLFAGIYTFIYALQLQSFHKNIG